MYSENDTVLYGTQGVCTIEEIVRKEFHGSVQKYYLLRPVFDSRSTIFAPCDSSVTESKMRELSSQDKINEIIKEVSNEPVDWIDDTNQRRQIFSEALHSGNSRRILKLAKTIYNHREKLFSQGKNLSSFDTRFLKEAEKIVFEEFAFVLDLTPSQVLPYILNSKEQSCN